MINRLKLYMGHRYKIQYLNPEGVIEERMIEIEHFFFGQKQKESDVHQHCIQVFDVDRQGPRTYALKDIVGVELV